MRLENKVAIVTGASSGIGKAIAEAFLDQGAKVIFSDISSSEDLKESENSHFVKCDVSKKEEVENLVKEAVSKFGSVDIMVNNAGIGTLGSVVETDDETWDKTIAVNLSGTFYGMRAAGKYMKENSVSGSIINMSSILGKVGLQGAFSYCASKGGVVQMTHAGSLDLSQDKIRVNAIAPGFIETKMTEVVKSDPDFMAMVQDNTPLGHMGDPDDIAQAAVYLASDESKFVTGEVLYVDGGWTAR